jgi:hypothetical protein
MNYQLGQNVARKTILNHWQNYDASVVALVIRKLCPSDERYIRYLIREDDDKEILGSFRRPFIVTAKDIKAVMNWLPFPASNDTFAKLVSMLQVRYARLPFS